MIKFARGRVEFWGRRLERRPDWTKKLPDLVKVARKILPSRILLDAELYSNRGRRFIPSLFAASPKAEALIYIFDVVFYENHFVGDLPLYKRKTILKKLRVQPPFHLVDYSTLSDLKEDLTEAIKEGLEGIVVKNLTSFCQIGEQAPLATTDWRKIK